MINNKNIYLKRKKMGVNGKRHGNQKTGSPIQENDQKELQNNSEVRFRDNKKPSRS